MREPRRGSRTSAAVSAVCSAMSATDTTNGNTSAETWPTGSQATRLPPTTAPPAMAQPSTVPARDSVRSIAAPGAVLVRPDGHVAWVGDSGDHGLRAALIRWFGDRGLG